MKATGTNREELRNTLERISKNEANRKWYEVIAERFPNLNVDERQLWYRSMDKSIALTKAVGERRGESWSTFQAETQNAKDQDWYQLAEERFPLRRVGSSAKPAGKAFSKQAIVMN
jgi:hypothetical protein